MRPFDSRFWAGSLIFALLTLFVVLAPSRGQAFSHAAVETYQFSINPQVRASSPTGRVDDLVNPIMTPGTFLPSSSFVPQGVVPGLIPFQSWNGEIVFKSLGAALVGTSNASGQTHRFELTDIEFKMSGDEFFRSPLDNSTLVDWTVSADYRVIGTYFFGGTANPFDISGTASATADHTNTSSIRQIRYLGIAVIALPSFSDGGVNYAPRIILSSTAVVVPEPSTALLMGLGLISLAVRKRDNAWDNA